MSPTERKQLRESKNQEERKWATPERKRKKINTYTFLSCIRRHIHSPMKTKSKFHVHISFYLAWHIHSSKKRRPNFMCKFISSVGLTCTFPMKKKSQNIQSLRAYYANISLAHFHFAYGSCIYIYPALLTTIGATDRAFGYKQPLKIPDLRVSSHTSFRRCARKLILTYGRATVRTLVGLQVTHRSDVVPEC